MFFSNDRFGFKDEDVTVIDPENPMPVKPAARQKTPEPVKVIKVNGVSYKMIHVEGSTFTMALSYPIDLRTNSEGVITRIPKSLKPFLSRVITMSG